MSIEFKKVAVDGRMPVIWRGECKMLPAGFKPKQTFAIGTVLYRGTPLYVNFEDLSAAICKVVKVLAGGSTTKPRVAKGHYFAVGDIVMKIGKTDVSPTISSIDTTNTEYDVITLSAAIAGLTTDDVLQEATAYTAATTNPTADAVPAKAAYTPNMVVGADCEFTGKGIPTIDAAYDAVILYPNVGYPILDSWLNGCCLKSNPNILFIKQ